MSTIQFIATAKCQVPTDFNLKEYLTSLTDFVTNHIDDLPEDIANELGDYDHDDVLNILENYVRELASNVLIECDSEESNGHSRIWDWLCDQFREDVMTGKMMEIHTASINSRSGLDSSYCFYTKSGRWIGSDDILRIAEETGIFDELD
jgi:hypothetical protein